MDIPPQQEWQLQNVPCHTLRKQRKWNSLGISVGCLSRDGDDAQECRFQGSHVFSALLENDSLQCEQAGAPWLSLLGMVGHSYAIMGAVLVMDFSLSLRAYSELP